VLDTVGKVSGSGSAAFIRLVGDREEMLEAMRAQHDHDAVEGMQALGEGVLTGITGVVLDPLRGARTSGIKGFLCGVGTGLTGLVLRPVAGVLQFVSIETEAASAALHDLGTPGAETITAHVRPRRALQHGAAVTVYDPQAAAAQRILQTVAGHHVQLVTHAMASLENGAEKARMVLLTPSELILASLGDDGWKASWRTALGAVGRLTHDGNSSKLEVLPYGHSHEGQDLWLSDSSASDKVVQRAWMLRPNMQVVETHNVVKTMGNASTDVDIMQRLCEHCGWGLEDAAECPRCGTLAKAAHEQTGNVGNSRLGRMCMWP